RPHGYTPKRAVLNEYRLQMFLAIGTSEAKGNFRIGKLDNTIDVPGFDCFHQLAVDLEQARII
ncbi:MAG: hypothetical protein O7C63_04820, partial [Alphaproteobacteria bacterium]|nr:hypothetical protein [Alphaproteobacteria bacterium]